MVTLKSKLAEAKLKLKTLSTRPARSPGSGHPTPEVLSPSEKRIRKAMGRFDRLETQVENLEARVRSYEVGGPSPKVWDSRNQTADPAVEEELARLKQRIAGPSDTTAEETSETGAAG